MSLLERVYFFHQELSRHRYPNARTIMREFEVSIATARRDIAYLRDRLLAPLAYDQEEHGFYYTDKSFDLPFSNSPKIAFLLGMLNRIAEETGLSSLPEIRQLEMRLSSIIAHDYNHVIASIHCEWIEVEHPDPAIFDTIVEAILSKRQLSIVYQSPFKGQTRRVIEPLKLVNYQGRWYVSAWCTLRNNLRLFHLARVANTRLGDQAGYHSRQEHTLDLESSFGIFKGTPRYTATILFTGTAAGVVKNQFWHKNQRVDEVPEGVVLHLPVKDDREVIMKILQFGAKARVLAPPGLADKVRDEIEGMKTLYHRKN